MNVGLCQFRCVERLVCGHKRDVAAFGKCQFGLSGDKVTLTLGADSQGCIPVDIGAGGVVVMNLYGNYVRAIMEESGVKFYGSALRVGVCISVCV